jgi:hypothetical protein
MCMICILKSAAEPVVASEAQAVCAIAQQHAQVLEQALPASRIITPVLLGLTEDQSCTAAIEWAAQDDGVTHVLTARVPDADRYLKVTYELVDLTRQVNYTGNGPEGQSVIGLDAVEAAIAHMDSVINKIESLKNVLPEPIRAMSQSELEPAQLIKRCLVALREHTR